MEAARRQQQLKNVRGASKKPAGRQARGAEQQDALRTTHDAPSFLNLCLAVAAALVMLVWLSSICCADKGTAADSGSGSASTAIDNQAISLGFQPLDFGKGTDLNLSPYPGEDVVTPEADSGSGSASTAARRQQRLGSNSNWPQGNVPRLVAGQCPSIDNQAISLGFQPLDNGSKSASGPGAGLSPIAILLKDRAEARGEMILLGEIALFQGADESVAGNLSRISLGRSPQPGQTVTVTSQSILYQIKNQLRGIKGKKGRRGDGETGRRGEVSLSPSPYVPQSPQGRGQAEGCSFFFPGNDRCLVARKCREVTAEEVDAVFRKRFFEQFSEKEYELEKVKVSLPQPGRVSSPGHSSKVMVPVEYDENMEYEIPFLENPSRQDENFVFKIKHGGETVKQIWISARLRYHTTVLVATRDLGRGEIIGAQDVTQKNAVLNRIDSEQIDDPAQIVGLVCRQPIRAGHTLTLKMVDRPILIKRGAIIKMTAESKNLRLVSLGRAKSDGRQGETISAENLTSASGTGSQGQGQMSNNAGHSSNVYGVVIGENQIRITF